MPGLYGLEGAADEGISSMTGVEHTLNVTSKSTMNGNKQLARDDHLRLQKKILEDEFEPYDQVNPINSTWINKFLAPLTEDLYTSVDAIDNSDLLENGSLKDMLVCGRDFYIVQSTVWNELAESCGSKTSPLLCPVISAGRFDSAEVDMRPLVISLSIYDYLEDLSYSKPYLLALSRNTRSSAFDPCIRRVLSQDRDYLIRRDGTWTETPLSSDELHDGASIFIVYKRRDDTWPQDICIEKPELPTYTESNDIDELMKDDLFTSSPPMKETKEQKINRIRRQQQGIIDNDNTERNGSPLLIEASSTQQNSFEPADALSIYPSKPVLPPGIRGLNNLGNTCFMNSALQCLSNTSPLTNFFLSGEWKKDLNKDNPLGMDGEVAGAYANLVQLIWSVDDNRSSSVPPRHFKSTIGRFNQTFVGYAQQDSQELIQFLLDGLHEDLNRILKKPYIEAPDMDGQPDHVIAEKSWEIYKARNDSAIVDIFQGEYKSRVECLECGRWSVKFDPYMFLSVPVPELREITISIIAVPAFHLASNHEDESTQKPTSLSITVIRDVNIRVLKSKVAEVLGWDSRRMLVVEVFRGRVYKYFRDWDRASELADKGKDEIIIYELSEPDWDLFGVPVKDRDPSKVVHLPIYLAHEVAESENKPYRREEFPAFGYPVFVTIPAEIVVVRRVSPNIAANLQEDSLNQFYLNRLGELLYTEVRRRILMITRSLLVVEQRMKTSEKRDLPIFSLKYYQASEYESHSYGANFYLNPSNRNSTSGYFFPPEEVKVKIPLRRKRRRGEVPETTDVPQSDDDERVDDFDREKLTSSAWTKTDAASGELDDQDDDFYTNEVVVEEVEDGEELVPKHYRMNGDLVVVAQFSAEMVNDVFGEASINDKQLSGCFTPDEKEVPQPEGAPIRRRADQPISLDDCLQEFMKEEHMGEEDTWYCPSCKEHRRIKKKLDIWSVPDILIFHLKRFANTGRGFRNMSANKIDALVDFPITGLDLTKVVKGEKPKKSNPLKGMDNATDAASNAILESVEAEKLGENGQTIESEKSYIYDLFAVSNHFGGLGGGHYTAYAKNPVNGSWYDFDDSRVNPVDESDVKTPAAYMLFYQRRNGAPVDLKSTLDQIKLNGPAVQDPQSSHGYDLRHSAFSSASVFSASRKSAYPSYLSTPYNNPPSRNSMRSVSSDDEAYPAEPSRTSNPTSPISNVHRGIGLADMSSVRDSSDVHDILLDDQPDAEDYDMFGPELPRVTNPGTTLKESNDTDETEEPDADENTLHFNDTDHLMEVEDGGRMVLADSIVPTLEDEKDL